MENIYIYISCFMSENNSTRAEWIYILPCCIHIVSGSLLWRCFYRRQVWQLQLYSNVLLTLRISPNSLCESKRCEIKLSIWWRQNERDDVSNHRHLDCSLDRLFRDISKKTLKTRVTGLCWGNPLVTGGFPSQMANNAENVSIWWRHQDGWFLRRGLFYRCT